MTPLTPLTLEDQLRIQEYFRRFPPEISEFTFTNLYVWQAVRPIWHLSIDDVLIFLVNTADDDGKKALFGAPVGAKEPQQVFNKLKGLVHAAVRVPGWAVPFCEAIGLEMRPDRDNADYIYQVADLARLEGRRYAKKRNQIKQCLQNHDCRFEPLTEDNLDECLNMQEKWCDIKGCKDEPGLDGEYAAIRETLAHYHVLPLIGGVARMRGKVMAYAIGERLNDNTAVWHFEKAMPDILGLGQLINQWFAAESLRGFLYVNREQDLGIPGLRQAKESYYPLRLVEKFTSLKLSPVPH